LVDKTGDHRRIVLPSSFRLDTIPGGWKNLIRNASVVFLSGFGCIEMPSNIVRELIMTADESGSQIVFDPQTAVRHIDQDLLDFIISHCDILTANDAEFDFIREKMGLLTEEISHAARALRLPQIFIRGGASGVKAFHNDKLHQFAGHKVRVQNTLGAGDCFNGALLYGAARGVACLETAILANAAAALKVSSLGTGSSVPTALDLKLFLELSGNNALAARVSPSV
jgi:ribokinase